VAKVTVVQPERKTLRRTCTQPGQVEAFEEAPIQTKIPGYVKRVLVDIGDRVTGPQFDAQGNLTQPGQVLAELAEPELEDDLQQKQALLSEAGARVEQAQAQVQVSQSMTVAAQARLREADATVERFQADAERWRSEHARIVELAASEAVTNKLVDETKQQWVSAQAAEREAAARVDAATAAIGEAEAGVVKAQSDEAVARAQQQVAAAEVRHAQSMLDYATLRAPFDGVVSTRDVHPGHFVQVGSGNSQRPLFVVVQSDRVRVFVDVPEAEAAMVDVGDAATILVDTQREAPIEAEVTRTSWSLNAETRTLRTEIDVDNPKGRLRPGMYVHATITIVERPNALVVPAAAIGRNEGETYCLAVRDGRTELVPVQLGLVAGPEVEIVSGLTESDTIVASGVAGLTGGRPV